MTIVHQLNPTIPVDTSRGPGLALGWIWLSTEHDLLWIVALDATGEVWQVPNPEVRAQKNWSMWRRLDGAPQPLPVAR